MPAERARLGGDGHAGPERRQLRLAHPGQQGGPTGSRYGRLRLCLTGRTPRHGT